MVVGYDGNIIINNYVRPTQPVFDYRSQVTNIKSKDLDPGKFGVLTFLNYTFPTADLTLFYSPFCRKCNPLLANPKDSSKFHP